MGLKVDAAVYCHIGRRANNEDNFYVNGLFMERAQMNQGGRFHKLITDDEQMYAVCDGMGGVEYGEEASYRAVKALKAYQDGARTLDHTESLRQMVEKASETVDDISLSKGMESGSSGSTLAMLILRDWYYRTVHVGDSRVYLLRDGVLTRVTKDDSEVQEMVDRGEITLDEAWQHPRKNVITKHLGMPTYGEGVNPTIGARLELKSGDRFLICSDGLSDALHDSVIRDIAMSEGTAELAAEQLARTALADMDNAGIPSDNITVVVLDVQSVGRKGIDALRVKKWFALRTVSAVGAVAAAGGMLYSLYRLIRLIRLMHR